MRKRADHHLPPETPVGERTNTIAVISPHTVEVVLLVISLILGLASYVVHLAVRATGGDTLAMIDVGDDCPSSSGRFCATSPDVCFRWRSAPSAIESNEVSARNDEPQSEVEGRGTRVRVRTLVPSQLASLYGQ